jgi:uncharacterized membrane protein
MPGPSDELAALRAQVAALTARVYQLERLFTETSTTAADSATTDSSAPASEPPSAIPAVALPAPAAAATPPPPRLRLSAGIARPKESELEKKIGQYWLNRIGIAAMLIGVSYFLKYAFENNWIGPAGRIAIGLIAGIALVLWSERLLAKNYLAFSY